MKLSHYIVGRRVQVYEDPITKSRPEGTAVVKRIIGAPTVDGIHGQYFAEVVFVTDGYKCERSINVSDVFGL